MNVHSIKCLHITVNLLIFLCEIYHAVGWNRITHRIEKIVFDSNCVKKKPSPLDLILIYNFKYDKRKSMEIE